MGRRFKSDPPYQRSPRDESRHFPAARGPLDPGGFGGVTITKAITITAAGVQAGVLVSGTNGTTVNTGANATFSMQ